MKRKILNFLTLGFVIALCITSTASAAGMEIQASEYLNSYGAYVYTEGNGEISIWFQVLGTGTMDEIGSLSIRLQEKSSTSSTWTYIKTYSQVSYPSLLGHNTDFYSSGVYYSGKSGYSYRAEVTVWAGKNGNGDSRVVLTEAVIA
ncbi:hypothetical protein [Clostridium sp. KNHs205]|jgi:hypothetical protein|uniref:hypothetical protein n=1 Tax=Clostridium sp. KNHs205 TaxID=1449050 RepID=UPI00051B65C6|nr:hypothetical protein [Clostridium sp. KNHs205]